jgi:TolB-like protein/DNA-binding winged helix-turn-helix (wHTH) protein
MPINERSEALVNAEPVDLSRARPFRLGGFEVEPSICEVRGAGGAHRLQPRVMQVLVALHRAGGAVVSRDDLIATCWDGVVVGEDAINRVIGRIRMLAQADAEGSFKLETVPRVGFRLLELPVAGAVVDSTRGGRRFGARTWVGVLIVLLAAAAVAALGWRLLSKPPARTAPVVAVLVFDSFDIADRPLARGLTAAIADDLSRAGLSVIAQSSSEQLQGAAKADAGRRLGAEYVIDGDLQRTGPSLRLSVRVDDTRRRLTLWTRRFDSPSADLDELERRAYAGIGAAIAWPTARRLLAGNRLDPQVVALFIQSSEADKRRASAEALQSAHRLIELAPRLPLANANLAIVTADGLPTLPAEDRAAAIAQARSAARRAVQLDPRLGAGYLAEALVTPGSAWAERERLLRRSVAVDPDNSGADIFLHEMLTDVGRIRESTPVIERALALDPLSVNNAMRRAMSLAWTGQAQASREVVAEAARQWPDNVGLIRTQFRMAIIDGDLAAADAILHDPARAPKLETGGRAPLEAVVQSLRTRAPDDAAATAGACLGPAAGAGFTARICLLALAMLGRTDDALTIAERTFPGIAGRTPAERDRLWLAHPDSSQSLYVLYSPVLAPLRRDPRFAGLMERLGMVNYWRDSRRWPDFCASEPQSVCGGLRGGPGVPRKTRSS